MSSTRPPRSTQPTPTRFQLSPIQLVAAAAAAAAVTGGLTAIYVTRTDDGGGNARAAGGHTLDVGEFPASPRTTPSAPTAPPTRPTPTTRSTPKVTVTVTPPSETLDSSSAQSRLQDADLRTNLSRALDTAELKTTFSIHPEASVITRTPRDAAEFFMNFSIVKNEISMVSYRDGIKLSREVELTGDDQKDADTLVRAIQELEAADGSGTDVSTSSGIEETVPPEATVLLPGDQQIQP